MILIRKDKLTIGHLSTAYHTSYILMENDDLANDLKVDINWILFGTGPAMVKAFKEEKLDIGYMGLPPAIIGIAQKVPIICIAGGHVEGTIVVAKRGYKTQKQLDNDLNRVFSQFKGKTIGVPSKGSIHDVILNYYLKRFNLLEEITIKNYEQAEFIAMDMRDGFLEAGVGTPALAVFTSTILESHLIIEAKELWPNNPSYGIFVHKKFIQNNIELVLKFLTHHKNASYLLRDSPSIAAEKISKSFEIIDKNYVEAVLKISPKYCIALSEGYIQATMKFIKTLHNLGYIKKNLKQEDIFDLNLVNKVHPEPDHYSFK
ncbi:MAG: ABC transporter substrate-binding protein [Candidatus Hermodarchaeota archaeon]